MTPLQAEINKLATANPRLSEEKMSRRLYRLDKMRSFYEQRIPSTEGKQAFMFQGFVNALTYAIKTIGQYNALTIKIAQLAEDEDETRADS